MGRRNEAVGLLRSGMSPSQIADAMGVSFGTVRGYLSQMVGEGHIRASEILFHALLPDARELVESLGTYSSAASLGSARLQRGGTVSW